MDLPAAHAPAVAKRLGGTHLRYSFRNWSDTFQCPTCGAQRRFALNRVGARREIVCTGLKIISQKKDR